MAIFCLMANADPLPSWNEGETKNSIVHFVETVTDKTNHDYVAPEARIATLDNDGTLWVEQPVYTQFIFAIDRVRQMASQHPEWKHETPYSLIINNDKNLLSKLSKDDIKKIITVTHTGMSVDDYHALAQSWLKVAQNPHYHQLYKDVVYQPMLEIIRYLHDNDFNVYIVTGGGQAFVRAFAPDAYKINSEHIIGTAGRTQYEYVNSTPQLINISEILFINNNQEKVEGINLFIGKKPIIAFGNSDGDRQMLEWTQSNPTSHLMLLIHHDDAVREYAYDTESKVGTFSKSLMDEAIKNHWKVVSMKKDWKVIFSFQK